MPARGGQGASSPWKILNIIRSDIVCGSNREMKEQELNNLT